MRTATTQRKNHGRRIAAIGVLALGLALSARAQRKPPLVLEATIRLPHTSGRIDHLAIDPRQKYLFVAEFGNGTVDVVDLSRKEVVHRVAGLKEPQGVLYAPAADRLAVASAGDGTLRLFSMDTFALRAVIGLGDDADNIRFGPDGRDILVGYGSGGLAVIDPARGTVRKKIRLAAHPEGFQVTPEGRVYVNVPDAGTIAVADLNAGKVTGTWKFGGISENFPMALGEAGIVAVVFRAPARFLRLDSRTGHEISRSNTCGDADDVFFDARRRRYYVSCGEGAIDVFQVSGAGLKELPPVMTSGGARTSLFVPQFDRLFVAAPAGLPDSDASICIMRPVP